MQVDVMPPLPSLAFALLVATCSLHGALPAFGESPTDQSSLSAGLSAGSSGDAKAGLRSGALSGARRTNLPQSPHDAVFAEFVVDTIVASVNGKPITLADVSARLGPDVQLSVEEVSANASARQALEGIIFEHLIEEEANNRKIRVSDAEVDGYIEEIAKKNQMSRTQFETALGAHGQRLEIYRDQVRADILRSRLIGQLMQQGAAVNDADIQEYLNEHPALTRAGSKVKLRQIVIGNSSRSPEEARSRAEEALSHVEQGESFAEVAERYSEGSEAADGGSLGVVAEEDLNPKVFEALLSVGEGQVSPLVELPDGYRLFLVERRYLEKEKEVDENIIAEVRKALTEKKLQERIQTFFTSDLTKLHTVDRKV